MTWNPSRASLMASDPRLLGRRPRPLQPGPQARGCLQPVSIPFQILVLGHRFPPPTQTEDCIGICSIFPDAIQLGGAAPIQLQILSAPKGGVSPPSLSFQIPLPVGHIYMLGLNVFFSCFEENKVEGESPAARFFLSHCNHLSFTFTFQLCV
jgi:hypothetical protein